MPFYDDSSVHRAVLIDCDDVVTCEGDKRDAVSDVGRGARLQRHRRVRSS